MKNKKKKCNCLILRDLILSNKNKCPVQKMCHREDKESCSFYLNRRRLNKNGE